MKAKQALRLSLDGAMLVLLLLIMGYTLTGGAVHEWMGAGLTLLILAHLYLNRKWFSTLRHGKYRWRRLVGTAINLLLALSLIVLIVASMPISASLFPFVHVFAESMLPSQLHIAAGNWFLLLSALHLGMQWPRVAPHLPAALRTPHRLLRLLLLALAAYGLWALWERNLHEKLVLLASFDFARFDATWGRFLLDYSAIYVLFTQLGYYALVKRK